MFVKEARMKHNDLSDLDKIGLTGLSRSDEEIPSSRISGLQVFVIIMLLILIGIVIFKTN